MDTHQKVLKGYGKFSFITIVISVFVLISLIIGMYITGFLPTFLKILILSSI